MLTNKSFIKWAEESVIVLIAHNELGHEEIEVANQTGENKRCPLYPGLTCRDHLNIAVETDASRDETLPVVPFVELCPNSWLIAPDGKVHRIEEKDQFVTKSIQKATEALQKELGEALTFKKFEKALPHMEVALAAIDDEEWRKALEAFVEVLKIAKKPGKGLTAYIDAHMASISEDVGYAFEFAVEDDDSSTADKRKEVEALLKAVDVKVNGKFASVREQLVDWLKKNATGG